MRSQISHEMEATLFPRRPDPHLRAFLPDAALWSLVSA